MDSSETKLASGSKRQDIISAAKQLLWERGYEATSPRDVLIRSGAGQGSLYHHFRTKLDLARAALQEMAAEEVVDMDKIFATDRPPLERIRCYLRRERKALKGCRLARLANEAAIELPEFRQPISEFLTSISMRVRDSLAEAQTEGALSEDFDPTSVAAALVGVVEGGFVLARAHWDPSWMETAIDGAIQLLAAVAANPDELGQPAGKRRHNS